MYMLIHEPAVLLMYHWLDACVTAARGGMRCQVQSFGKSGRCASFCHSRRAEGVASWGVLRAPGKQQKGTDGPFLRNLQLLGAALPPSHDLQLTSVSDGDRIELIEVLI